MENMGTKSLIKVVPSFVLLISFITQEQNPWEVRLIGKRRQMGYMTNTTTRGVSHCGLAISGREDLKAKEELWKFKYCTMQKYNLQKNPLKETKILQDIVTL
jgi:hypothetical protein